MLGSIRTGRAQANDDFGERSDVALSKELILGIIKEFKISGTVIFVYENTSACQFEVCGHQCFSGDTLVMREASRSPLPASTLPSTRPLLRRDSLQP